MSKKQHTEPCSACPWRRKSAPGWLGASTPEEFLAQCEDDYLRMPCHLHVDYEDENWEDTVDHVPQCVGRAAFLRNRCKMPRGKELAEFVKTIPQREDVFRTNAEFLTHHKLEIK